MHTSLVVAKRNGQAITERMSVSMGNAMSNPRRDRFRSWFRSRFGDENTLGTRTRFMQESGYIDGRPFTKGRVTQLFDDDEPFGERAAASICQKFGLPLDAFESSESFARLQDATLVRTDEPVTQSMDGPRTAAAPSAQGFLSALADWLAAASSETRLEVGRLFARLADTPDSRIALRDLGRALRGLDATSSISYQDSMRLFADELARSGQVISPALLADAVDEFHRQRIAERVSGESRTNKA